MKSRGSWRDNSDSDIKIVSRDREVLRLLVYVLSQEWYVIDYFSENI